MGIALQENAQREETKRLEAEEIAKMNECPASECGPWPEEKKGEDPEYSVLLTSRQAELVATALRQGSGALELLAQSGIIRGVTAFFVERFAEIGKNIWQALRMVLKSVTARFMRLLVVRRGVDFGWTIGFRKRVCTGS